MAKVYHAVGKRKTSVARAYLQSGNGDITVNDRSVGEYFPAAYMPMVMRALAVLDSAKKYAVDITVRGGGVSAQAHACMHAIAKALTLVSAQNRSPLKKAKLLTRDSRVVERKKYGHKKARRSFQFSKR